MNRRPPSAFRRLLDPAPLCRLDAEVRDALRADRADWPLGAACSVQIVAGMALFGAAFGIWRSPLQALYGAIKMPVMLHAVVWLSIAGATMLNWLLGAGLTFRQVRRCVLASLAIASALLAALAPAVAFLACQAPGPGSPDAWRSYHVLLGALVVSVGVAGLAGNLRLYQLVCALAPSCAAARRTLLAWILVAGLVGTQCSWLLSPFVQRPDNPVTWWNPLAFRSNFFEYLWQQYGGLP